MPWTPARTPYELRRQKRTSHRQQYSGLKHARTTPTEAVHALTITKVRGNCTEVLLGRLA